MYKTMTFRAASLFVLLAGYACGPATDEVPPDAVSPEEAERATEDLARRDRLSVSELEFEEFKRGVYREPFAGGKFIVNGDTSIVDEKQLREFFEREIRTHPAREREELIVHQVGGLDAAWNREQKLELSYCVSETFGNRHTSVVGQMEAAANAWEAAARVDLVHDAGEDGNCDAGNSRVVFDVRPVDVDGEYAARAFFPNEPRAARNVLIDETAFELAPGEPLQLVGILRHELGHTLGFRHEHTRPSSGRCFEDNDWRPVTSYDAFSVMHYPHCNGLGDWTLALTKKDKNGAACLYGATDGFDIDTAICAPEVVDDVPRGEPRTETFSAQSVALDEWKEYGPFDVAPGSLFEARIGGPSASGDPDLYVRFGFKPRKTAYDCRPYLEGAEEACAVDVPQDGRQAWIKVHGYALGTYDLVVTHTPLAPDALVTGGPREESAVTVELKPEEANRLLEDFAVRDRQRRSELDFEAFKASVYREPGGKFIVNGDTAIVDEKHLREFFESMIQTQPKRGRQELVVALSAGLDAAWNREEKLAITYCVSNSFGARHPAVVAEMGSAAGAWEEVANVDFSYQSAQDGQCNAANNEVVFDVRPVAFGAYLARAFFPNDPRSERNVLIDDSSFTLDPGDNLTLTGILRHELGHTLGFRHEHTRPESGACFEDSDWRVITDYDAFSVMHYPQCNGRGDWSLTLTAWDQSGAACLYGAAQAFAIDASICTPEVVEDVPSEPRRTETFAGESVALDEWKEYGPFAVAAGTVLEASIGGASASGDPDLYVRFLFTPRVDAYDCRPFLLGARETCAIDVPSGATRAWIKVHGYAAGTYDLVVTHSPPTT